MSTGQFILCATVVLLVAVGSTAGHRGQGHGGHHHHQGHGHGRGGRPHHHHHRHHHGQQPIYRSDIRIDIYSPKGLEVYVRKVNATVQYFALQMYVNAQDGNAVPDVSLNTSETVYGKFFLRDPEAILRPGDSLIVSWTMGLSDGNAWTGNWQQQVHANSIKSNCTCDATAESENPYTTPRASTHVPTIATTFTTPSGMDLSEFQDYTNAGDTDLSDYEDPFDCEIDPATNLCRQSLIDVRTGEGRSEKLVHLPSDERVRALRVVIDSLLEEPCRQKPRTRRLTLAVPQSVSLDSSTDWLQFIRGSISESPLLKAMADKVIRCEPPSGGVIVFEMRNLRHKLVVLQQAAEVGMREVQDYDST